jgi:peptidyl-dipeptidase Dcp
MLDILMNPSTPDQSIPFNKINTAEIPQAIDKAMAMAKERIKNIENNENPNFKNIIEALELSSLELEHVTTLFFNLYQACTDSNIDAAIGPVSEKLANHGNDIQLSEKLFKQVKTVFDNTDQKKLNKEELKLLTETYEGFTRNGALLNETDKEKLRKLDNKMASLSPQYSQNLLKATNAFTLNITDKSKIESLPESVIATAHEEALKRKQQGWTFTLQAPSYIPFLKYMDDRSLRENLWMAYNTKALTGEFSNRELCQNIATLRQQRAQLLGYPTHAHFVLQKRMAKNPETVIEFLDRLKTPAFKAAQRELNELQSYVTNDLKENFIIQPWDFAYYSEKYKKFLYDINDEELRPYFPLSEVIKGVFLHGQKLYGLEFKKDNEIPVYHPDVEAYRVTKNNSFIGLLYLDIFPRDNKKAGAWMTTFREQGFDGKTVKRPHVSLVCNFSKPTKDQPSLLTFNEVQTLFHEFGHGLHSLLSNCHYQSLGGTHVLWDFVELPSQIMENWTYQKESLDLFAHHYKTGETIPTELVEKLRRSMLFQEGYATLRQVSFSLVDFNWHTDLKGKDLDPIKMELQALKGLELMPKIPNTNFSVSFSHVFAGGYSAGYYSYKWAEVLDADAFEAFTEKGIFNKDIAQRFYDNILSRGGVEDPAELYRQFRGKDPDIGALLRRSGLN